MEFATHLALLACASGVWLDVPFVRQSANGCGAACAAMVVDYWKLEGRSSPAGAASLPPKKDGIRASSLAAHLRGRGLRVFTFAGEWSDLERHLAKGRPLIVALEHSRDRRHFVVVAGIDPEEAVVLVNDPARRKLTKVARPEFERAWRGSGSWTLLAVPIHAP